MQGTKGNTPRETNTNLCMIIQQNKAIYEALTKIQAALEAIERHVRPNTDANVKPTRQPRKRRRAVDSGRADRDRD